METSTAMKKPSAMANLNAIAKTNWITGATINRKEPEPNIRRFIPKRTITGKLKPGASLPRKIVKPAFLIK